MIGHNAHRNENRREETRLGGRVGRSREKQRGRRGKIIANHSSFNKIDQCSRRYWMPIRRVHLLSSFLVLLFILSTCFIIVNFASASTFPLSLSLSRLWSLSRLLLRCIFHRNVDSCISIFCHSIVLLRAGVDTCVFENDWNSNCTRFQTGQPPRVKISRMFLRLIIIHG